ncbi:unnamed protein product [Mytilus edulis]|uniref:XK-related protein n=1 Tax=Mytilus edulis TaxID=6550 RepID=A0A8S3RDA4_MYTED|nr:unnamed protein product [Mytilus edulis]
MDFKTTPPDSDFITYLYYLNCTKSETSTINQSITTPFDSYEITTSDTLSSIFIISESFKIPIMGAAIFGMVMAIILYAAAYRVCCSGGQPYHDSYTKYAQLLARGKENIRWQYLTSYLTLVEATLESAPQLTVQIYLAITDTHLDTSTTSIIRYLSMTASALGLAWSLNALKHQVRKTDNEKEDDFKVKMFHWCARLFEIGPRILLIALVTAEYSILVLIFIMYRFAFGCIYGCCERWSVKERCRFLEEPDLILGIIGNIFCFSVSEFYKCHKKEQCGGKFFAVYYILYYTENSILLYLWYSDDPGLLYIKLGGACSNHERWAPGVFAVVTLACVLHLLCLNLYYCSRRKQHRTIAKGMLDETCSHNASLDKVDQFSSGTNRRQFDNCGFQVENQTNNYQNSLEGNTCDYGVTYENDSHMQRYYEYDSDRHVDQYRGEKLNTRQLYESEGNSRCNTESYQSQPIQQYNTNQQHLQHLNDYPSQSDWYASNRQHFIPTFHNQTFGGNVRSTYQASMQSMTQGAVFIGTQYNSQGEYRFSGY